MALFSKRNHIIGSENAFKMGTYITHLTKQGKNIVKLNLGEPDFDVPVFIKEEIKNQVDLNNTHYCDPKGLLNLREVIAYQISQTRKIDIAPEQVVIFPGAKPSIGFSQQVYCNPGDEVIYPSPSFPIFESFIRYLGGIPVPLHLKEENGFAMTAEQLAPLLSKKTKLIYLNSPSNPTGNVASQKELEEIADLILKRCHPFVRIYSDEIYENIIFENLTHHSIASIPGMEKRTIISSGFSKSFSWTGGRIGYAAFPTVEEADAFKNLNINYFSCVPPYNQEAARLALVHPDSPSLIAARVKILEERRNLMVETLNQMPSVHCHKPMGAFYVFLNIHKACKFLNIIHSYDKLEDQHKNLTSPSTLFQMFALFRHNLAVLDRRSFGKEGVVDQHYIRLSFGSDPVTLKAGLSRLKEALEDINGFKDFIAKKEHLY